MIRCLFCMAVLISFATASAKENPKYVVGTVPPEFRENVNAIFWEDKVTFQIHSKSRATEKVLRAITILNENGKEYAKVVENYSKLSRIVAIRGTIYDKDGNILRKIKQSEIYDQSAFDGVSLFSDSRLKYMNMTNGNYPYTIEYEYEIEYKYLFYTPNFYLLPDEKVSCLHAEFTFIYPKELKPRFKATNIGREPTVTVLENGDESTSWTFSDIKPITLEAFSPPLSEIIPNIVTAPSVFEYSGYGGKMESWDNFGAWISSLNKGRNVLPQTTIDRLKSITDAFPKTEDKIRAAYQFMQSKTRYVSIQLGIGGFQPFEASVVDEVGYGDCKALSNYMVSLLSSIGIKSHYVLVRAGGTGDLKTDFPSVQFNHAIVCVPMQKDTVWLECTSQTNPFGFMGSFTGNRKALAITDNGAVPVRTPVYTEKENIQSRTANVTIDALGDGKAKVITTYSGVEYEPSEQLGNNFDEQRKWIQANTQIPVFDIGSFSLVSRKEKIPSAVLTVDLTLRKLATISGKRLFLQPNLMNRSTFIPPKVDQRKNKVFLKNTYTHIDTVKYTIPEQIFPEHLPDPIKIDSRFGSYDASFALEQGKVVYIRKFVRKNGSFPSESYQELIDFYKNISRADNTKIVFLNKT